MELHNKTIFITGGCGFIGISLAMKLASGNNVILFDNQRRNALDHSLLSVRSGLSVIKGDVRDPVQLADALPEKVDLVFHCAAITGASTYAREPLTTMDTNILGTLNLLRALKDKQVGLLVNFSSSEIYGMEASNVAETSPAVIEPLTDLRWSYAVSKIAAESYAFAYMHEYGLPVVTVRPCNIYGPFQVGEGAIHNFIGQALRGEPLVIHGDGQQTRSWCYIDDLVAALCQIVRQDISGEIFNIGNYDEYVSIRQLAELIIELAGSCSQIDYQPIGYADIVHRRPETRKLTQFTSFYPCFTLAAGLAHTIDWYRQHPAAIS